MKRVTSSCHEKTETTARLAQINLAVHGLEGKIRAGNEAITYYKDPHELAGNCDFVMANPPFNVDEVDAEKVKGEALARFVTDGRLEADNNIAENAMRAIALGRKNYLFCGSDTGSDRAASIYTLVQTAKLNGVNPEAYLKGILTKIAAGHPINRINELTPWRMLPAATAQPP